MMNNKNGKEPISVEKLMNGHLAASYMAKYSAEIEEPLQTVAYKNLIRISAEQWQRAVNYSKLIMAFLDAGNKGEL
jgi:hypothetical protein